ncbi:MAG: NADH-quinone oxidoreductase subunit N [Myxococcales bacterium]|nr:NADH-quinone oxidoreductase subunit N [Myxococcales bacterium]
MTAPDLDLGAVAPLCVVAVGAALMPLLDVLLGRTKTFLSRPVTAAWAGTVMSLATTGVLSIALVMCFDAAGAAPRTFNRDHPMILMDGMTSFLNIVILIGSLLTALASGKFLADLAINRGEYYALLLAAVLGMMLLVASTNLMMLFVGLELMSIPIYAMAGFRRDSLRSNESALKYFLVGSFASGILLYGTALIYGATGTLSLLEIGARFDVDDPVLLIGSGLLLVGLAFKIATVPFHQWAPDVYEGAPTLVSGLMATTVKVAAFGALLRVFQMAFGPIDDLLYPALWVMAVLTMTVGNVMAIIQQNTKRMLAYSSVAHTGYLLVGILVGTQVGISAVLFYLLAYTFMTLGAFGVVAVLAHAGRERERIADLAGLANSRIFLAAVMTICMVSLAGIPGTAGFMGKFYIFRAVVEQAIATESSSLLWLAVIGVLNSAISLVYYLRVPMVMFMREPEPGPEPDRSGTFEGLVLAVCAAAVILLGIWPEDLNLILTRVDVLHWASVASASP